jgi:hypothetical protein
VNRREFLAHAGVAAGGFVAIAARGDEVRPSERPVGGPRVRWTRDGKSALFSAVSWDGVPLVRGAPSGLLDGGCRLLDDAPAQTTWLNANRPTAEHAPLRAELQHRLIDSGRGLGEDLLEATLVLRNVSTQPLRVEAAFATSVQPSARIEQQRIYIPLNVAGLFGDDRFAALGVRQFLKDCDQPVGRSDFRAHYLEPMASYPSERETRALLLAPVVDISHPQAAARVGLFTSSLLSRRFSTFGPEDRRDGWHVGRCLTIGPGESVTERCWLLLHEGDAAVAWKAFHRYAHREEHPPIDWLRDFRVLYYDYLSSANGENGRRGDGYDADLRHFREFRVGMAVQHGYYPALGDYIQPDRKTWKAMPRGKPAPTEMSLDVMRERIKATRAAGARAAVYLHASLLDDATPLFEKLRDCVAVDAKGAPSLFPWDGPDTDPAHKRWRCSMASPLWREHLLQQAQWIMDILKPDALVIDETFVGLGYDHHPRRAGPNSAGAIDFYRKLRSLVRSFGRDKAVMSSDCSMSGFVLWADGESGDHNYPDILGNPLYTQEPVRYLAALGDKPWRPCAWHFQRMWDTQMKLARQVGAGVGVSNGWIEYTGLTRLPAEIKAKMLGDIATL